MSRIRKKETDPTKIRLSDHFLLSDFMGCHSVFVKGYRNLLDDFTPSKLAEGRYLCETLLEPLLAEFGPMSVAYGYISPELSRKVVAYQDPDIPSYHRWDKGAAADVCVHSWVKESAPIHLAHWIDEHLGYSRMITYSESPFICLATQLDEGENFRRAFYENRYGGKKGAKPEFVKKSTNAKTRIAHGKSLALEHDWKGAGYPTYHGGGIRQMQHIRVSRYSMVSDFLYSTYAIREGIANAPDIRRYAQAFRAAGRAYDRLLEALDVPRLSIVRGFESFRFNDYPLFSWRDHFAIDFIPPAYMKPSQVAEVALSLGLFDAVGASNQNGVVRVSGRQLDAQAND